MTREPARHAALSVSVRAAHSAIDPDRRPLAARPIALLRRFLVDQSGPTAVEYALMLSLVMVFCMAGVRTLGSHISGAHASVSNSIASEGSGHTAASAGGTGRSPEGGGKKSPSNKTSSGANGGQSQAR